MSSWFRTPQGLRHFKEAMRLILRARGGALNARYAEVKEEGYPDTLEEGIAMIGPEFAEQAAMELLCKLSDDPRMGLRLNDMSWSVIETTHERDFLISDAAI